MEVALREQISVERVVYSALAEQLNALERLEERAARSSEDRFRAALAKIPDVEPPEYDRLS
jgi:flagellar motor switch protein FliM